MNVRTWEKGAEASVKVSIFSAASPANMNLSKRKYNWHFFVNPPVFLLPHCLQSAVPLAVPRGKVADAGVRPGSPPRDCSMLFFVPPQTCVRVFADVRPYARICGLPSEKFSRHAPSIFCLVSLWAAIQNPCDLPSHSWTGTGHSNYPSISREPTQRRGKEMQNTTVICDSASTSITFARRPQTTSICLHT